MRKGASFAFRRLPFAVALALWGMAPGQEEIFADEEWTPFYAAASGGMLFPGVNTRLHEEIGLAETVLGWYADDTFAYEARLSYSPDATGALFGIAAGCLRHWWGFERFDPFFTFGGAAWCGEHHSFAGGAKRAQGGFYAGSGFFWHLTERASFRIEGRATLAADESPGMTYAVLAGIQWSW